MRALAVTTVTLASDVANNGTFTVSYPTGSNQASLRGSTGGRMVVDSDASFGQGAGGFTAAFGTSNITVTNTTGATLTAGRVITISFGDSTQAGRYETGARVTGLVDLTTSVGTAGDTIADVTGTFSQTVLNNNFRSLATKINELNAALRAAGIING
jgi:hypothetical protein